MFIIYHISRCSCIESFPDLQPSRIHTLMLTNVDISFQYNNQYKSYIKKISLRCSWSFAFSEGNDNTDPVWTVMHKGLHEHPAPFPIGASKLAKKTLRQYLAVDPNLTAVALQRGNAIRGPIYEMDIKFFSLDYLRQSVLREKKEVY